MACFWTFVFVGILILCELFTICQTTTPRQGINNLAIQYTREVLLSLRNHANPQGSLIENLPREIRSSRRQRVRKRGRRGGVRQRVRKRGNKPPLPTMILCNARSLNNKMDELRLLSKACFEYRESCLMLFTETWLRPEIPDLMVEIEGFTHVHADRTEASGKRRGAGSVCMSMISGVDSVLFGKQCAMRTLNCCVSV